MAARLGRPDASGGPVTNPALGRCNFTAEVSYYENGEREVIGPVLERAWKGDRSWPGICR